MESNSPNFSKNDIILNDKYIIKDLINDGATANVFKCIDKDTGESNKKLIL